MDAAKGIALATLLGIGFWCLLGYAAFAQVAPAPTTVPVPAPDPNCLTAQEGNIATTALNDFVIKHGLSLDSKAAIDLAVRLGQIVQRCEAAASAAHDAALRQAAPAAVKH